MNEDQYKNCLDPENNSKCCFFKVANAFLLLAVFLQFVILCFYAPRVINGKSLGFDYMGVIVAVLAALITFAVGWQIWQFIAMRDDIKDAKKVTQEIEKLKKELEAKSNLLTQRNLEIISLIDAHSHYRNGDSNIYTPSRYLDFYKSVDCFIKSNISLQYEPLQEAINFMTMCLDSMEDTTDKDDIARFVQLNSEYEVLYKQVMESIHKRQDDIDEFRQDVIDIRDRRRRIVDALTKNKS